MTKISVDITHLHPKVAKIIEDVIKDNPDQLLVLGAISGESGITEWVANIGPSQMCLFHRSLGNSIDRELFDNERSEQVKIP